jgi:hypothetical protein
VTIRGWRIVAVAVIGVAGAVGLEETVRRARAGGVGPLNVSPPVASLSVRVGESVEFSASAPDASRYTWSIWGRVVSEVPTLAFVPGPEDAGWQQVVLVVSGAGGARAERRWDVGVVAAVVPEVLEVAPPEGVVARSVGEKAELRVSARVPAARSADRLRFAWTVDDHAARQDERAASAGTSELVLPTDEPGTHRVVARVSEDDRVARLVEWTVDVVAAQPPSPPPTVAPSAEPPPPLAAREAPRLVPAPGPRALERTVGEPLVLATRIQPDDEVVYEWSLDGRHVQRGAAGRYEYLPSSEGRHRVAVTALAPDGRTLGADAWTVTVRAPTPPPVPPPPPPSATLARTASLADDEVRRWLDEYARAWSRKDMAALRRMGQVRTVEEAEKLERYFRSISDIHVEVRVVALRIEGNRAAVEFERTDTVTDPSGRRQELRLPRLLKEIERTPQGLRFAEHGPPG